jgi:hypothetical protein
LADLLREQAGREFIGPVQIGAPLSPVGARVLLPPLRIQTSRGPVILVGGHELAWIDANAITLLTVHTGSSKRIRENALCRPLLASLLFGLALRAGETMAGGEEFRRRFADRKLLVYIAHEEGVARYCWSPKDLLPEAARDYLTMLAEDLLDPRGFDLLPADILLHDKNKLEGPYLDAEVVATSEEKQIYAEQFQTVVDEDEENERPAYYRMKLLQIVPSNVPDDAFDKVRRRFRLLDIGLARARGGDV